MPRCTNPFNLGNGDLAFCGKCLPCRKKKGSEWSFRLMQESKKFCMAHFITLTYDNQKVPITGNKFMGLSKRDLQLFFKRLRKYHFGSKAGTIKYFAVGEYGGKTFRPHYHAILFGVPITFIQQAWNLGQVHYGTVTGASIGYCLKYIIKKGMIPMHKNDDRPKEFALMSKGLGKSYINDGMKQWHLADLTNRMYCTAPGGVKLSMPRYYKDKIYDAIQRECVKEAQQAIMRKREEEELSPENYAATKRQRKTEQKAAVDKLKYHQSQSPSKI